jgi:Outer membrane protein beta-barrel domain
MCFERQKCQRTYERGRRVSTCTLANVMFGFRNDLRSRGPRLWLTPYALLVLLALATPAQAQYVEIESFEVTPFVGARLGGTFDVRADQTLQIPATWNDATSYGVSAGVRFDEFSLIEFRWTRSTSTLGFDAPAGSLGASVVDVTLNQFHADFTREFVIPEVKGLRSFLTGSVGATHIAGPHDGFTRFSFGFGAGLKQFLGSRFAIRAEAQWLPILIDPEVSAFACGTVGGGCLVVLSGPLTQQFEFSVGPVVRF